VQPVETGDDLLRRLLSRIDHVLRLLEAFVERRIIEQTVFFLEDRQHRLSRRGGPAAEHGRDAVVDQQLVGLLRKRRPIAGAVFLNDLNLSA
jgi:hypothetical protein